MSTTASTAAAVPMIHGIVPPLVTPLLDRDTLDQAGLERLIEHIIAGGVTGVFILGTTGEAPSLSYRLRRELITRVTEQVRHRIPVLVGVADTSFVESVALANHAADCGADALVLTTPYYFPAGQTELTHYIRHIAAEFTLPLCLYNMPGLTKVWFEIETLRKLADIDRIIGIKDSSGDLDYFAKLTKLKQVRPDWSVMIGPEAMLPAALSLGGDGAVAGGANAMPQTFVDCYRANIGGDGELARNTHARIVEFQKIYEIGKYASRFIKATKCSLSLLEICDDHMAEPFHHFHAPERQRVAAILSEIGLLPTRST